MNVGALFAATSISNVKVGLLVPSDNLIEMLYEDTAFEPGAILTIFGL